MFLDLGTICYTPFISGIVGVMVHSHDTLGITILRLRHKYII